MRVLVSKVDMIYNVVRSREAPFHAGATVGRHLPKLLREFADGRRTAIILALCFDGRESASTSRMPTVKHPKASHLLHQASRAKTHHHRTPTTSPVVHGSFQTPPPPNNLSPYFRPQRRPANCSRLHPATPQEDGLLQPPLWRTQLGSGRSQHSRARGAQGTIQCVGRTREGLKWRRGKFLKRGKAAINVSIPTGPL